jgi:cytochrome P450 PksS
MEPWRARAQEIVDELIDAVEEKGSMDLIEEFASILPLTIILEILGIPTEDGPKLHHWTKLIANALGDSVVSQQVGEALQKFYAYLVVDHSGYDG